MKCQNCGTSVMNGAQFCPNCGSNQLIADASQTHFSNQQGYGQYQQGYGQTGYADPTVSQGYQQSYDMQSVSTEDAPVWMKIVCFFIWIVGVVMYFAKKEKEPVYAKSCLTWGLIGLGTNFVCAILF